MYMAKKQRNRRNNKTSWANVLFDSYAETIEI
jgi:hypothetical protein